MTRLARLIDHVFGLPTPKGALAETIRGAGIDLLGCVLAGAAHPFARQSRTALARYTGESVILGGGGLAAAPFAALCNGTAGHVFEFDDWEEPGNTHPSVVLFPTLWALAAEDKTSGADLAVAYCAGFEVIARLGEAFNLEHYNKGWHSTGTLGAIGAAAAAARLLNLNREQMGHALSLAMTQSSGFVGQFGSSAKALHAGFAARDGLISALLARQGMTGQAAALDAANGFCGLMSHGDLSRLDHVLASLDGSALAQWGLVMKAYPSCGYTHRLVDCALDLHKRVDPRSVVKMRAELPDFHNAILPFRRPETATEARFSIPYCVSVALERGRLTLADFEEEAVQRQRQNPLLEKVEVQAKAARRPHMNYDPQQPDKLEVTLGSGEVLGAHCAYPKGAPQNPLTQMEIRAKFEAIAGPYPAPAVERLMAWDQACDINDVLKPFGDCP